MLRTGQRPDIRSAFDKLLAERMRVNVIEQFTMRWSKHTSPWASPQTQRWRYVFQINRLWKRRQDSLGRSAWRAQGPCVLTSHAPRRHVAQLGTIWDRQGRWLGCVIFLFLRVKI